MPDGCAEHILLFELPGEVAIVTIRLKSTTFDVIELRARPLPDSKIGLRWVDEYESAFTAPTDTIERPFSFKELIGFIEATELDEVGNLPVAYTGMNVDCAGWTRETVEELRNFSTLSSDFYPQIGDWAQAKIDEFLEEGLAERGEEESEPEEEDPCSAGNS